jgi:UDP-N-acetylglucosamine:LPS N-acetylglucosamine transferase
VPVVIHDVLTGQEAGNLAYAHSQQAVVYAPNAGRLTRTLIELYDDPVQRAALAQRGQRLARPEAARHIAAGLLERLGL